MSRFDISLGRVLKHEGGYVHDSLDSGGRTNLGVTQAVWEEFVGHPVSEADMRNLTVEKVSKLYKQRYWDRVQADKLPKGVDYVVFDFAINAGVGRAVKTLQSTVGATPDGIIGNRTLASVNVQSTVGATPDGIIGNGTLASVNAMDAKELVNQYSDARVDFYQGIVARKPDQARFIRGWLNRVEDARKLGLEDHNA